MADTSNSSVTFSLTSTPLASRAAFQFGQQLTAAYDDSVLDN